MKTDGKLKQSHWKRDTCKGNTFSFTSTQLEISNFFINMLTTLALSWLNKEKVIHTTQLKLQK